MLRIWFFKRTDKNMPAKYKNFAYEKMPLVVLKERLQ